MTLKFVIVGGGPAGHSAATTAARLGAEVVLVEREIVGGGARLLDCIPSKAMIGSGGAISYVSRLGSMGLSATAPSFDLVALAERNHGIQAHIESNIRSLLVSQGVRIINGTGRLVGERQVEVDVNGGTETLEADSILLCTGSSPRVPDFCTPDAERILISRQAYPPPELPEHIVIVGSGVTGVEFSHLFSSIGSKVTLIVSRQQVLPGKDAEVAAELEDEFLRRGIDLLKGARATSIKKQGGGVKVLCQDGRHVEGSHALLAIGSVPNSEGIGLEAAGIDVDRGGYVPINRHCQTNVSHIYAGGDLSGKLPLASVAMMQGRKIAEHVMGLTAVSHRHLDYDKAAQAIFTEPEIAEVGIAEAEAFSEGRKIRVTKVPFSSSAKAMIEGDPRGFVKIISDPATGVVLGGSIVGRNAAELIAVLAVAVTAGLKVADIVDALFVHPSLSEVLAEAAE